MNNWGKATLAIMFILFAVYVWPTAWRHHSIAGRPFRTHRITGKTQVLNVERGWEKYRSSQR